MATVGIIDVIIFAYWPNVSIPPGVTLPTILEKADPPSANLGALLKLISSSKPPYDLAAFLLITYSPGSSIAGTLSPSPDPGTQEPPCALNILPMLDSLDFNISVIPAANGFPKPLVAFLSIKLINSGLLLVAFISKSWIKLSVTFDFINSIWDRLKSITSKPGLINLASAWFATSLNSGSMAVWLTLFILSISDAKFTL